MNLKPLNRINFSALFSSNLYLSKEIFCDKKSTSYVKAEYSFQLKLMVSILMMLLTQLSFSQSIYFEDGICKCPSASVGETQTIGGITYTVVDNSNLSTELSNNNYNLCTTKVTIMRNNMSTNGDITFWDVSNVTDMRALFSYSNSFNQDISGWDVSSVTNMESMFANTGTFNQDISGWDVSSVTNMKFMFKNASAFNQDISSWDFRSVRFLDNFLINATSFNKSLAGICGLDLITADNPPQNFSNNTLLTVSDLPDWSCSNRPTDSDTSLPIYFEDGICKCPNANVGDTQTINDRIYTVVDNSNFSTEQSNYNYNLCTTKVTIMRNNMSTNGDITFWDVSNVTDMRALFSYSNSFNQDISGWDVSSVTNMESMFANTGTFNQDISGWDVSSVTNMKFMFKNASAFNQDISSWCVSNMNAPDSFASSPLLDQNKPNWGQPCNSNPTNISLSSTSIEENKSIGTTVGSLSTIDSDSGDTHTYSLVSGTGDTNNTSFSINGANLLSASSFDYETKTSYSIVIQTSDGTATYSKTFTISVTDVDEDSDGDGITNNLDNCPSTANANQADIDGDGVGDVCDNAPNTANANQLDTDGDGVADVEDLDDDNDGVPDTEDAFITNSSESIDSDGDGIGDELDPDADNDGILDENDNCITVANTDQADLDGDGIGDVCDSDRDGDGYSNSNETNCESDPSDINSVPADNDKDYSPDCIDTDDDNDGYKDTQDTFPLDATEWTDNDADGTGDNADTDDDNDGWLDTTEETCGTDPKDSSDTPVDTDQDGDPDCIDTDDDNDSYPDTEDAFPLDAEEWIDTDLDGIGDNADPDDDNDEYLDTDEISCESDPLDRSSLPLDFDGDLIPDCIDDNDDNDYCLDVDDDFPLNNGLCVDTDGDGIDNQYELDADDDGVWDDQDDFPLDPNESKDTDGDGIGDNADEDDNNDGFPDFEIIVSTVLTPNQPGLESTWKIINVENYPYTSVKVYAQDGSIVHESTNYFNEWNGTNQRTGQPLPTGPYYYRISLGGTSSELKEGWLYIFN